MTTATTTTRTIEFDSLEDVQRFVSTIDSPVYAPIEDDVEFLTAILKDLDTAWITGYMCTLDGKRCLVGSGSLLSGAIYHPVRLVENYLENRSFTEEVNDDVSDLWDWTIAMDSRNSEVEHRVGARLYDLLGLASDFYYTTASEDDEDKTGQVIEVNDADENFTTRLRPIIVDAITRAHAARVDA